MIRFFLRWMQGYLKIKQSEGASERFINLCRHKNIVIWNLIRKRDCYEFCILLKDFYKLRAIRKKTNVKIKIIEKCGFPFLRKEFGNRKTFLTGAIGFIILIYISSQFIWNVEFDGNYKITDDLLSTYFKTQGISIGTRKNVIDGPMIVKSLRQTFDEIAWASAYVDGTELRVSIKESINVSKIEEMETYGTDIVAKNDGTITSIVTRSGTPMVKAGDVVKKGDILVSGMVPILESYKLVCADADVEGESTIEYSDEIAASYSQKVYDGKKRLNAVFFIHNQKIVLGFHKPIDDCTERYQIGAHLLKYVYYSMEEQSYTMYERETILNDRFAWYCEELKKENIVILENDLKIIHENDKSYATCNVRVKESIGVQRKIIDLSLTNMLQ